MAGNDSGPIPMTREHRPEHVAHALESRRQLRQATFAFEHMAIRILFVLNGGGLIAFLTLLGTDFGSELEDESFVMASLSMWLGGLALAAFATAFAYWSRYVFLKAHGDFQRVQIGLAEYPDETGQDEQVILESAASWTKRGHWLGGFAFTCVSASIVAFAVGAVLAILGYLD